jgi:preprotein translocase subunit SecE
MMTKVKNFFSEVKVELQKCSWPWDPKEKGFRRYKELVDSTIVVAIAMLLLGGYVALFDFILAPWVPTQSKPQFRFAEKVSHL